MMARLLLLVLVAVLLCQASSMKLYKKMPGGNKYRPVLVAVSSTVIPLDDLPTFTVSSHLGPATEAPPPGVTKPSKPTKLITANDRKKPVKPKKASVLEITKKEFDQQ